MKIDGQEIAKEIIENLKKIREKIKEKLVLGIIKIGHDPETDLFIKQKEKIAKELNIDFRVYNLKETVKKKELRNFIKDLVKKKYPQGLILQLPLPKHLNQQYFLNALHTKDIECLTVKNLGYFFSGKPKILPPSVKTVEVILKKINFNPEEKNCLVLGYGKLIGKPIAHWLREKKANLILPHRIEDDFLLKSDLIISGVGVPKIINKCKKGAVIIDFGYKKLENKIYGDLDEEKIKNLASYYTPTPGGTGPILVACLFENFLEKFL